MPAKRKKAVQGSSSGRKSRKSAGPQPKRRQAGPGRPLKTMGERMTVFEESEERQDRELTENGANLAEKAGINAKNGEFSKNDPFLASPLPSPIKNAEKVRIIDPTPVVEMMRSAGADEEVLGEVSATLTAIPADLELEGAIRDACGAEVVPRGVRQAEYEVRNMVSVLGKDPIVEALASSASPEAHALVSLMTSMDPEIIRMPFSEQCRRSGLEPARVMSMFRDYHVATAVAKAASTMPRMVQDLEEDSRSIDGPCGSCRETGTIWIETDEGPVENVCIGCGGRGRVRQLGSDKARGVLLEIAGVRQKGGGVNVFVNPGGSEGPIRKMQSMDDWSESTDRAMIDVTPIHRG